MNHSSNVEMTRNPTLRGILVVAARNIWLYPTRGRGILIDIVLEGIVVQENYPLLTRLAEIAKSDSFRVPLVAILAAF